MNIFALTDIGRLRSENQDNVQFALLDDSRALFVVCDGMGGAQAGNVASRIAAEVFLEHLKKYIRPAMSQKYGESVLINAINFANYEVYKKSMSGASYSGMGTTLVGGYIQDGQVGLANVGDSRAYTVTAETIGRLTRDHSVVEEMLLRGDITQEEARRHPRRNLITRALGTDEVVKADMYACRLAAGEQLLLCSDGLSTMLGEKEIFETLSRQGEPDTRVQALIDAANAQGGYDNITALLICA